MTTIARKSLDLQYYIIWQRDSLNVTQYLNYHLKEFGFRLTICRSTDKQNCFSAIVTVARLHAKVGKIRESVPN